MSQARALPGQPHRASWAERGAQAWILPKGLTWSPDRAGLWSPDRPKPLVFQRPIWGSLDLSQNASRMEKSELPGL